MSLKGAEGKRSIFIDISNNDPQFVFLILKSIQGDIFSKRIRVYLSSREGWDYSFIESYEILKRKDIYKAKKFFIGKILLLFRIILFWCNIIYSNFSKTKVFYVWNKYSFFLDMIFLYFWKSLCRTEIDMLIHRPDLLRNKYYLKTINLVVSRATVFSNYAKELLLEKGFSGHVRVFLHPNFNVLMSERGILSDLVPRIKLVKNKFSFLFISSLSTDHGITRLIGVIDNFIANKQTDFHFYICGNYRSIEEENNAKILNEKYGNSTFVSLYFGFYTQREATYLIENSEIVICPYRYNIQSGVIALVKGFEKRIIASDVGAAKEMLDDNDLLISNELSSKEWYEEIIEFIQKECKSNISCKVPDSAVLRDIFI